ncbi:hypothetical protein [Nesterenkonia alba]|uniref:hypothetical protein n=1 Tax=Nesterenkonia alba TaxID=515814 RepID=UPI0003B45839|nr:hypothetical protein [Nesterenkonia alba]
MPPSAETAVAAARRHLATVLIDTLNPVGVQLAEHLAQAQVGTLLLRDEREVCEADVGRGFRRLHVGFSRAEAVRSAVMSAETGTTAAEVPAGAGTRGVDVHVLTGVCAADLDLVRQAAETATRTLVVSITGSGIRLGPLLGSGTPLCAECCVVLGLLPEHRQEHTAPQLEALAAAAAAHQVLALIDAGQPVSTESAVLTAQTSGVIHVEPVKPVPDCRCIAEMGPTPSHARYPGAL